jgi:uncharacterized protein
VKKFNLKVQGMTCASCEVILERSMKKVEGVHNAQVSRSKENAYVHCDENVQLEDLQAAVSEKGYTLISADAICNPVRPAFIVKNKKRYAEIGAVLLFIIGAYVILNQFNLLPEGIGVTDNMSYGFVFLIGLVAATSTCLAVAGGLLLAVANKHNAANPHLTGRQKFQPHIWFNIGRCTWWCDWSTRVCLKYILSGYRHYYYNCECLYDYHGNSITSNFPLDE